MPEGTGRTRPPPWHWLLTIEPGEELLDRVGAAGYLVGAAANFLSVDGRIIYQMNDFTLGLD